MALKVAVVGTGMIANAGHIPAWQALSSEVEIVGVQNRNIEKAQATAERHRIPRAYADLQQMLRELSPDIVSVCTPNVSHASIVTACLEADAHVVCEKPLTTSYSEALDLYALAEQRSRRLVAAQTMRFGEEISAAHRIARTGVLGDVYYAEAAAFRRRGIPTWGTFHLKAESGGGPIFDLGVHVLDSMLWIMGNPRVVAASGATFQKHGNRDEGLVTSLADSGAPVGLFDPRLFNTDDFDVEDLGAGLLRFEDGGVMILRASWAANVPEGFARPLIVGTEAGMTLNPLSIFGRTGAYQSDATIHVPGDPETPFFGHHRLARHVVNLIAGTEEPIIKRDEVLNVLAALTALYRSAETGREEPTDGGA